MVRGKGQMGLSVNWNNFHDFQLSRQWQKSKLIKTFHGLLFKYMEIGMKYKRALLLFGCSLRKFLTCNFFIRKDFLQML